MWLDSTLYDGLPFALVTVAFLLTFRYLRFADLTTAGTFVLGGAVAAQLTVNLGVPPHLSILAGATAGALAGSFTAVLITSFRVEPLLAGIVSAFALYSINLLMVRPTLPYGSKATILNPFETFDRTVGDGAWHPSAILYFTLVVLAVKVVLDLFLSSETGLALRAMEDLEAGEATLERIGVGAGGVKLVVIALSNALVAASGAIVSMKEGAANAHRGFDIVITGLVAYVVGTRLLAHSRLVGQLRPTTMAIGGSLLYFGAVGASYRLGVPAEYTRLLLAGLVAVLVIDSSWQRQRAASAPVTRRTETQDAPPAIELVGVSYRYPSSDCDVLQNVTLTVGRNEFLHISGENGSGKTTLVKLVAGVLSRPTSGTIKLEGVDVTNDPGSRKVTVAYIDQSARLGVVDNLTVEENLVLARLPRTPRLWRPAITAGVREELGRAFAIADLDHEILVDQSKTLSGGQRQIVNLAQIIARPSLPAIIIVDEPANNLDQQNRARVWALLGRLHERGSTLVVVAHGECGVEPTRSLVLKVDQRAIAFDEVSGSLD